MSAATHELAHLVATTKPPDEVPSEWSFFGWEYLLAKRLRVARLWRLGNRDYNVNKSLGGRTIYEFRHVTEPDEFRAVMKSTLAAGRRAGCIVRGRPVPLR